MFSYCLCPAEGLNLGLEMLGLSKSALVIQTSKRRDRVWPRFSPDLTPGQQHNLHVSGVTVLRGAGACRGSAAVGGGVIRGTMHDQLGEVQVYTRE